MLKIVKTQIFPLQSLDKRMMEVVILWGPCRDVSMIWLRNYNRRKRNLVLTISLLRLKTMKFLRRSNYTLFIF